MEYTIREIEPRDNAAVEAVIRSCLVEYGANHEGTAWADPDLGRFSGVYAKPGHRYWVAEVDGRIVGGVGIGALEGDVCELQKMYCYPEARGTGIARELIGRALDFASRHYKRCYLETFQNMTAAQRFYEKHGFRRIYEPIGQTGHFACDVLYIREV